MHYNRKKCKIARDSCYYAKELSYKRKGRDRYGIEQEAGDRHEGYSARGNGDSGLCIGVIKETYGKFGFTSIETPCVENIENLTNKQGGENEKLIFKILKRGEKLKLETAQSEQDLVDGGLRYDLTVPLVRYYSNHANELPSPFKALQMGNVWRADRPQRGRYRQFMQCDIDILGEPSNLAEIELILATTTTLGRLGFKNFQIRINERRILKAMAAYSGFPEESYDSVFITLDKMDKIGLDGVKKSF